MSLVTAEPVTNAFRGGIRVRATQFARGDFPFVCAMTGQRAETYRTFTFSSLRWWPLALLPLGGLLGHAALGLVERRATGRLPLTRAADAKVRRAGWQGLALMVAGLASFAAIFAIGLGAGPRAYSAAESLVAGVLLLGGLLALTGGAIYLLAARYLVGPRGAVGSRRWGDEEAIVEIWNVHPEFVVAVRQALGGN